MAGNALWSLPGSGVCQQLNRRHLPSFKANQLIEMPETPDTSDGLLADFAAIRKHPLKTQAGKIEIFAA